jgi:hypothetical protein
VPVCSVFPDGETRTRTGDTTIFSRYVLAAERREIPGNERFLRLGLAPLIVAICAGFHAFQGMAGLPSLLGPRFTRRVNLRSGLRETPGSAWERATVPVRKRRPQLVHSRSRPSPGESAEFTLAVWIRGDVQPRREEHQPPPPRPRRQPPDQRDDPPHRRHPRPLPSRDARLHRTQALGGQEHQGGDPLPQQNGVPSMSRGWLANSCGLRLGECMGAA